MATILGRRKTQEAPSAPTLEETISEQNATDTLRGKLDTLRPRIRDMETDLDAIEVEVSDMLLADLMGVKVDGSRLNEIYTRREANRRELEESRSILQRAEAQLTAMVDQENARLAAISRAKLQTIGDEIAGMEAEYVKKIAEFGDFFEAMLAKRMEYRQADSEFGRYSPNRGSGLQGPRPTLFAIPERYLHGSTFGLPTLREQIQRWAREPEERREASRREHEVYALRVGELREQERIAQERAERLAQQGDTYRYP